VKVRTVREDPVIPPPPAIKSVVVELTPGEAEVLCLELEYPRNSLRSVSRRLRDELVAALDSKHAV